MVKKIIITYIVVLFMISGCSKTDKVVITSHRNNDMVSEVSIIRCEPFEESKIKKVKLYINGIDALVSDNDPPWALELNTTEYENNSDIFINILSFDIDGDSSFSDTLNLTVDNSNSYPEKIAISEIVLNNKGFNLEWEKSEDDDFLKYYLEKSNDKTFLDAKIIFESNIITDINYRDKNINPLKYQYYRLSVEDIFGYKTIGDIFSSNLEKIPSSVNVKKISYGKEKMTVFWEKSTDSDFSHYTIYRSSSSNGYKNRIKKIKSKNKTSFEVEKYNPLFENWFWVEVTDIHGYSRIGAGKTNQIDLPPSQSNVLKVDYNDSILTINWNQNKDDDFKSYELKVSNKYKDEHLLELITDQKQSFIEITDFDPTIENNYFVITTDIWNQSVKGLSLKNKIDAVPDQVNIKKFDFKNLTMELEWSKSNEDNFSKYYICHTNDLSIAPDTIAIYDDINFNYHKFSSIIDPNIDNWVWVIVTDSRNQSSISPPQVLKNNPPKKSYLDINIDEKDNLNLTWNQNLEPDFKKYLLYHSNDPDMKNKQILLDSEDSGNTNYNFIINDHSKINYFQIIVEDIFGLQAKSEFISSVPSDLQVLLDIVIENNLNVIPSELGTQIWIDGRLTELSIGNWSDGGGTQIQNLPESIGKLRRLKNLWLSYNKLTKLPDSFSELNNLEILELRSNSFSKIPSNLMKLNNLKYLGLSYNSIKKIPDWLLNLKALNKLYLSHNYLSEIPDMICEMNLDYKEMENSFLSQNRLCTMFLLPECIKSYIGDQSCSAY